MPIDPTPEKLAEIEKLLSLAHEDGVITLRPATVTWLVQRARRCEELEREHADLKEKAWKYDELCK